MAIQLGNTNIGSIYLGSTKISEAYLGSTKIFSATQPVTNYPYIRFQLDGSGHPRVGELVPSGAVEWVQVSSSPNIWDLKINHWYYVNQGTLLFGLPFLFSSTQSTNPGAITSGNVIILSSYGLDQMLDGEYCQNFDRMFNNCTGLVQIASPIQCSQLIEVGSMFNGCTNIASGQYDQYTWLSTNATNITSHSGTFYGCGSNTTTGAAELAQIPVGWGGTLVPASTLMTSSSTTNWGSRSTWLITGNAPDWEDIIGMYLFTEASVSTFAGVSMNRGRITKRNGLNTTQGSGALYFYPAFAQYTGTSSSNRTITWVATTDTPNGTLTVSQGNTDMPGTLDYSTYGPITRKYGTYDSSANVYFLFLVTNVPIANWTGLTDAYGVLYNNNFKADGGFRYFY
jgi:hypothetical protein